MIDKDRSMNQDYIIFDANHGFGIVADGIGGRPGGDIASRIVGESLAKIIESTDHIRFDEIASFMLSQVDKANAKVKSTLEASIMNRTSDHKSDSNKLTTDDIFRMLDLHYHKDFYE